MLRYIKSYFRQEKNRCTSRTNLWVRDASVRGYTKKALNQCNNAIIIYLLLHFKQMLSDIKSYFKQEKIILTWSLHGMFFFFMPVGHTAMVQTLVTQTKWKNHVEVCVYGGISIHTGCCRKQTPDPARCASSGLSPGEVVALCQPVANWLYECRL